MRIDLRDAAILEGAVNGDAAYVCIAKTQSASGLAAALTSLEQVMGHPHPQQLPFCTSADAVRPRAGAHALSAAVDALTQQKSTERPLQRTLQFSGAPSPVDPVSLNLDACTTG